MKKILILGIVFLLVLALQGVSASECSSQDCDISISINITGNATEEPISGGGGGSSWKCSYNGDCDEAYFCDVANGECIFNQTYDCGIGRYLINGKCVSCDEGEYYLNGECKLCDGTIFHKFGKDVCIKCQVGFRLNEDGSCTQIYPIYNMSMEDKIILFSIGALLFWMFVEFVMFLTGKKGIIFKRRSS